MYVPKQESIIAKSGTNLYIPSTLNIDIIQCVAHTIDCVCRKC